MLIENPKEKRESFITMLQPLPGMIMTYISGSEIGKGSKANSSEFQKDVQALSEGGDSLLQGLCTAYGGILLHGYHQEIAEAMASLMKRPYKSIEMHEAILEISLKHVRKLIEYMKENQEGGNENGSTR